MNSSHAAEEWPLEEAPVGPLQGPPSSEQGGGVRVVRTRDAGHPGARAGSRDWSGKPSEHPVDQYDVEPVVVGGERGQEATLHGGSGGASMAKVRDLDPESLSSAEHFLGSTALGVSVPVGEYSMPEPNQPSAQADHGGGRPPRVREVGEVVSDSQRSTPRRAVA